MLTLAQLGAFPRSPLSSSLSFPVAVSLARLAHTVWTQDSRPLPQPLSRAQRMPCFAICASTPHGVGLSL